tara:strand:- start:5827 stop:8619 length:2793 start_codon:yes stop_codon:yes gene_type:complete
MLLFNCWTNAMPSKSNSPVKGLLPLFIITNLVIALLAVVAYSFYPTSNKPQKIDKPQLTAQQLSAQLTSPLVSALTMPGQDKVKEVLDLAHLLQANFDYYLYRYEFNGDVSLVYANNKKLITPSKVNQQLEQNSLIHTVLELNDQPVGELIVKQHPSEQPVTQSTGVSLALAAMTLLALIILSFALSIFINKRFSKSSSALSQELKAITENADYQTHVTEELDFGLNSVARHINLLLNKVQSAITENKASQADLQKLQSSLENEVHKRTLALEQATLKAEQANETKTTFLATMSHEIRTPMNGVIGTIDLLRQTELDGAQHRLSTIIRDSAFSLLGILDDILDFSKIEAGKLNIDNIPFSVSDTIEEVARVLSSVAKKRDLELELAIAPDIPTNLIGDTVRVRQVLYNLCSNAIKFTSTDDKRKGHVKISVEVAQNTTDHYTLRFSVLDNGKGMTQAQLREIFNPFIQAEGSITREYGGTGLGLSICKSLTELMLGTISVSSDLGIGSEFVVELPFSTQGKVEYAHKQVMKNQRVVVVTNHDGRKKILTRYLSFMGATPVIADNSDTIEVEQDKKDIIWILDGIESMEDINYILRRLLYTLEDNKQQVIVLSKLDEAAVNHKNIFYLNAAPLCKSNFMMSLLVAAGLHKPKQITSKKSLNDYLSVDKAREENKLVLLVEDNVLNQQVLTDQLHLLGYGVELAENGEKGLEAWREGKHSIILTDLHMPKMSGYDMVEIIRNEASQLEDINAQPYVIAITANALKGEKERCLSIGMNDYITKPVELNVLEATLHKCAYKTNPEATKLEVKRPAAPIDMNVLADYVGTDENKKLRFFKMYLEQSYQLSKEVNSGVIEQDLEAIISACHQLKSISKTIGAMKVAELAAVFEQRCKEDELSSDDLIELRDSYEIEYSKVAQYLKEQIKKAEQDTE